MLKKATVFICFLLKMGEIPLPHIFVFLWFGHLLKLVSITFRFQFIDM